MASMSRLWKSRLLWLSIVILAGVSCRPRHETLAPVESVATSQKLAQILASPENIIFPQVYDLVLRDNCLECHGPELRKDNIDVTSYSSVVSGSMFRKIVVPFSPEGSSLYASLAIAAGRRHMPPLRRSDLQLSEKQIDLVYLWIENGAKEKLQQKIEKPPSLKEQLKVFFDRPETIDHKVIEQYVFKDNCIKCHSLQSDGIDKDVLRYSANLTSYKSLFSRSATVIAKGDPIESSLYEAVAVTQGMPPQEEGYDPLKGYEIQLLRLWILNCAIEDYAKHKDDELIGDPDQPEKVRLCEGQ